MHLKKFALLIILTAISAVIIAAGLTPPAGGETERNALQNAAGSSDQTGHVCGQPGRFYPG